MPKIWSEKLLGDVIELKRGYDLPATKRFDGPTPIISSSGPSGQHNKAKVAAPGVVTGRYGTIGKVFYITDDFWPLNTTLYVRDFKGNDPRFISYFLRGIDFLAYSDKAAVPGVNRNHLHEAKVHIPDPDTQKQIVRVLASLDDKIELNRQMNETLEEMARALFRDWFVDFGPTRRQMDSATDPTAVMGHAFPPEKAAVLTPLFPSTLGDDGLPEQWVSQALGDRVTVKRGGSPRPIKDFIRPAGIPWVKIADATRCNGPNLFVTREFIKEEGLKKTVELQPGSLILSNSATPGLPKFLRIRACIHDGWLYFPETGSLSNEFLYLAFLHFKDAIVSQATGSVFNNLKTDVLKRQEFVFPPNQLLAAFDRIVGPLFNKILANEQENQTLAEMRDLLLPKLMSGEIRLKDAEAENKTEAKPSNVIFATDMFGEKVLTPEQEAEREAVMVAANVHALQTDDLLVGNVRLMKANYLIHRRMGWSTDEFERRAAGPHCKRLNDVVRETARQRSWIRQTTSSNAQGKRIPGNRPANKFSEVEPLITQYGLSDAIDWLRKHFNGASRDWMECVATVDDAMQMLIRQGADTTVENVKANIAATPEWKPKLLKPNFSDGEIRRAIKKLREIL